MNHYDYLDAGLKIFGLHGVGRDGVCGCGDAGCKAFYKHPRISQWQRVPAWSDAQIETMEELGHFATGFGVLCDGLLVVDVDPRNGGAIPEFLDVEKTFTVQTGGGGWHIYYKAPVGVSLVTHLESFKGVDFKSSGFVVGAGSLHASGVDYAALHGSPDTIADAPEDLIKLLERPAYFRSTVDDGQSMDVTAEDLAEMLSHCDYDCGYDDWIRIGMAIHHTTMGTGFELWDDWSRKSTKYPGWPSLDKHWQSFGRGQALATLGTLLHLARLGGYVQSCEFVSEIFWNDEEPTLDDLSDIDLNAPPCFLGELTRWVNDQCLYPSEQLAVAAALQGISALSQGKYSDEQDSISTNMIAMCVAGSGTGKESILTALTELMRSGGQTRSMYGSFKSEQEIIRNLVRDRCSTYVVDEMGIMLGKVANAKKSGAHYLEGVTGAIMSIYSKANSAYIPSGDAKAEMAKSARDELAAVKKMMKETGQGAEKIAPLEEQLRNIDDGIKKPYLSITGFANPVTFDSLMTFEMATNGLMARAMIFQELETNPRRKECFKKRQMEFGMDMTLKAVASGGGVISTTPEARALLNEVYERFHAQAENEKGRSGLEAIPRRGYEIAAKVSLILAIPSGIRTEQMVRYGYALALRDTQYKVRLAYTNTYETRDPMDALAVRITKLVSKDHGETRAVIINRCASHNRKQVEAMIEQLISKGVLDERIDEASRKKSLKIYLQ